MALKKEVQIRVDGSCVRGNIVNGVFHSSELVVSPKQKFSIYDVQRAIEELEELQSLMKSSEIADILEGSK